MTHESWQVKTALLNFLDRYLKKRDIAGALSLVTEDVYSIGTGIHEIAHNRAELAELMQAEIEQLNMPIEFNLSDYFEQQITENAYMAICTVKTSIEMNGILIKYETRLTVGARQEKGRLAICHLHMSEPSSTQQEYEFFPVHYVVRGEKIKNNLAQRELLDLMKKMIPGGVMGGYVEKGFPLYFINDAMLEWLGFSYDELILETGGFTAVLFHPDDLPNVERVINESFEQDEEYLVEYRMRRRDGSYIWIQDCGRKTLTPDGRVVMISVMRDITEIVRSRRILREQAEKDPLTKLYNRRGAMQFIGDRLQQESHYVFLSMDIDNFKQVNDIYGHAAGDELIIKFASILRQTIGNTNVIARWGGDEFIVIIFNVPSERYVKKIIDDVQQQYNAFAAELCPDSHTDLSTGGIYVKNGKHSFAELYQKADEHLYEVKRSGKAALLLS